MTTNDIILRQAFDEDRDAIVRLLHDTWRTTFAPFLPTAASDHYFAARIAETYVAAEWPAMRVAEADGAVIGFAHAEDALIAALHVAPAHWGHGIGRRLLADIEAGIASEGHAVACLQVEAFNHRAIELYDRAGYVEAGRGPDTEFGSDGETLTMARPLDSGDVRFRAYRDADRDACLMLFDSNVPDYFAPCERADFIAFLNDLHGPYLLVENDAGEIVATGGFQADDADPSVTVLCWGMVRHDLHRRGLGEKLLATRIAMIRAHDRYRAVTIDTTPFSRGFFARAGFTVERQEKDGFTPGYDLVAMRLVFADR